MNVKSLVVCVGRVCLNDDDDDDDDVDAMTNTQETVSEHLSATSFIDIIIFTFRTTPPQTIKTTPAQTSDHPQTTTSPQPSQHNQYDLRSCSFQHTLGLCCRPPNHLLCFELRRPGRRASFSRCCARLTPAVGGGNRGEGVCEGA